MKNITKISIVCLFAVAGMGAAQAIPSVRNLGGAGTYAGTSSASAANTNANTNSVRASSLRTSRMGAVAPATVAKTSGADSNVARLSLGKLLHNTGVKKGVITPTTTPSTTPTDPTISGSDLTSLQARISAVESSVSNMNGHISDTNSHVSASDRNNWNSKQDALTAGMGISIENGVISSTGGNMENIKIPVGSETATPTATIWIE